MFQTINIIKLSQLALLICCHYFEPFLCFIHFNSSKYFMSYIVVLSCNLIITTIYHITNRKEHEQQKEEDVPASSSSILDIPDSSKFVRHHTTRVALDIREKDNLELREVNYFVHCMLKLLFNIGLISVQKLTLLFIDLCFFRLILGLFFYLCLIYLTLGLSLFCSYC